jgi:type IV secretory pathway VirB10-like protein
MKPTMAVAMLGLMLPCIVGAQDVRFEFGTTLNATLSDTVDARKSKPGDPIKAKASEDVKVAGIVAIPRGAKLIGKITQAQVSTKADDQARLGFVFDRAELKDGRQVPLQTAFYALAARKDGRSSVARPWRLWRGGWKPGTPRS